jgi:acyl transferase domain-containing protein
MTSSTTSEPLFDTAIAVIGMSGRFPGAQDIGSFWNNIATGVHSIQVFSDDELRVAGVDPNVLRQPHPRAGAVIEGIDRFDAEFFDYTQHEAARTDPQQRLFLECAWEALELAAYNPVTYAGAIGVFADVGHTHYPRRAAGSKEESGAALAHEANDNVMDTLATTVAFKLNLHGPSMNVQTPYSTSLAAVHIACLSLIAYDCDIVLAGGVQLALPYGTDAYHSTYDASPDGRCRSFDMRAQGCTICSGTGVVVLKRMDEAIADRDHIYAVIRGSAMNTNGRSAGSRNIAAPNSAGMVEAISKALNNADIHPDTLSYIEAQGNANPHDDAAELAALRQIFQRNTAGKPFCALGSIKPNVGNLGHASGIASLIKTTLALTHKQIPPILDCEVPRPELANSPFYLTTQLLPWPAGSTPRRAAVNGFGQGGTNVHIVLEESPLLRVSGTARAHQLLLLSAKTPTALEAATTNLATYYRQQPELSLPDIAYTLQVGRHTFRHRRALVCRTWVDVISTLETLNPKLVLTAEQPVHDRPVVWLFAGSSERYLEIASELYATEPAFRAAIDHCYRILRSQIDPMLHELIVMYGRAAQSTALTALDLFRLLELNLDTATPSHALLRAALLQPAAFMVEYALAQLLLQWGIQPQAMLGCGVGEYVAACIAGVITLDDTIRLLAQQAYGIRFLPPEAALLVLLPEAALLPLLAPDIRVAAIGQGFCAVAGALESVRAFEQYLAERQIEALRLPATSAASLALPQAVADSVHRLNASIKRLPPRIPYVSSITGDWITAAQATDPGYWGQQLQGSARLAESVHTLLGQQTPIVLHIGGGSILRQVLDQSPADAANAIVALVPDADRLGSYQATLALALGQIWLLGASINWEGFYEGQQRRRVPLPTYPFERQHFRIEPEREDQVGSDF